jgi:hypothetical protein
MRDVLAVPRSAPLKLDPPARDRIIWVAVAEGRGHLVRAALAARLLAPAGIAIEIVTTNAAGAVFARELDLPASVMSSSYRLIYDDRQNLARTRTHAMAMTYLLSPKRCLRDLAWLEGRTAGAALIVNDSFHPALLSASLFRTSLADRIVHVHGENTRLAVEDSVGRGPMRAMVRRAFAASRRIEITLGDVTGGTDALVKLPPLLPAPRPRDQVRAARGIAQDARLAVVYLNPYFANPELADALERELAGAGYVVHAVGEGYADRPGWRARDGALTELVSAADLFVSAAGSGALALARGSGVPMIALATDQPEQRKNLASAAGGFRAVVDLCARDTTVSVQLRTALARVPPSASSGDCELAVRRARSLWLSTLIALTRKDRS